MEKKMEKEMDTGIIWLRKSALLLWPSAAFRSGGALAGTQLGP